MTDSTLPSRIDDGAIDLAEGHVRNLLAQAIEYRPPARAMVVWDGGCELSLALTEAYRRCLPTATFMDFESRAPEEVLQAFKKLDPGDLVVLIQSTNFRLAAFRIRMELFRRSLKVVEHPHLSRMVGSQGSIYIDSLAYDPRYYRGVGRALKALIDSAQRGVVESGGEQLVFAAGFESAKLNVGDYREMRNVGGQYPIGEVFTESLDLEAVEGRVRIHSFGDTNFRVNRPEQAITLVIGEGRIQDTVDSTPEFEQVLENIRRDEGEVRVRELGFGMNRAFTRERMVSDIGTYERMCGIHLSIGAKHASYNKAGIRKKTARHHVDVFAITEAVLLDGLSIYADGAWTVEPLEETAT